MWLRDHHSLELGAVSASPVSLMRPSCATVTTSVPLVSYMRPVVAGCEDITNRIWNPRPKTKELSFVSPHAKDATAKPVPFSDLRNGRKRALHVLARGARAEGRAKREAARRGAARALHLVQEPRAFEIVASVKIILYPIWEVCGVLF